MKTAVIAMSFIVLFAAGCGSGKSGPSETGAAKAPAGRPDTKAIEAATAAGYDGSAMRRSVDKAMNQADAKIAEQKKAIEQLEKGK